MQTETISWSVRSPTNDIFRAGTLAWNSGHTLHGQFGNDVKDYKTFRRNFKIALRKAVAVYPAAKVELE